MEFEERNLLELLRILLKRKWWIISSTIVAGILGLLFTMFLIIPHYKSNTTLMVNGSKGSSLTDIASSFDLGSVNLSQKLVVTYSEIVKSRIVLEQVIDKLELDMTYNQLLNSITSQPVKNTEILRVSVEHEDPEQAAIIANKISDIFIKEVMRILKVNNVEIIDAAIPLNKPINVNTKLNIAFASILGMMLSVFATFLIEILDRTIKTTDDVTKHLDLPILGSVIKFDHIKEGDKV